MGSGKISTMRNFIVPNIVRVISSRRLRLAGHVAKTEVDRSAFKSVTDKPTRKKPIGRPRRRWKDNIRMNFKEIDFNTRNLVDSVQDRYY